MKSSDETVEFPLLEKFKPQGMTKTVRVEPAAVAGLSLYKFSEHTEESKTRNANATLFGLVL